ncbi:MAG: class II fructose-bisphosphate aldolase family protein [Candidatus Pacebacteria bacterium]|nr:class II fructose-bisphosphate aldolase family protein [Candidatus Paceibacterota bacterium]
MTIKEALQEAGAKGYALGHFNVSDSTQLNAIAEVSRELSLPVLVGVSEGERKFFGMHAVAAMVGALRKDGATIFLNADHTHDVDGAKECIDAGFDSVMFDGSKLPLEENIQKTREVVAHAQQSGREVFVEGELGYIGSSSALLDKIPEGAGLQMTTPEEAAQFVREGGVSMLAPSVGNIHGMLKDMPNPRLDISRIGHVAEAAGIPLVLHGGSGTADEDFVAAIKAGIRVVHINTEIRVAYRKGIHAALNENPDEVAPYKYLGSGAEALKAVVRARMSLFAGR